MHESTIPQVREILMKLSRNLDEFGGIAANDSISSQDAHETHQTHEMRNMKEGWEAL
jgi:hypothetical protein